MNLCVTHDTEKHISLQLYEHARRFILMNELEFKVGEWYEVLKPGRTWNHWNYNEETKKWSKNLGDIVATKFLLLKIFQIEFNDDVYNKFENIGKFLTPTGQITFYRLKGAADDLKPLCLK